MLCVVDWTDPFNRYSKKAGASYSGAPENFETQWMWRNGLRLQYRLGLEINTSIFVSYTDEFSSKYRSNTLLYMSCSIDGIHCPKTYLTKPVKLLPKMAKRAMPDFLLGRCLYIQFKVRGSNYNVYMDLNSGPWKAGLVSCLNVDFFKARRFRPGSNSLRTSISKTMRFALSWHVCLCTLWIAVKFKLHYNWTDLQTLSGLFHSVWDYLIR